MKFNYWSVCLSSLALLGGCSSKVITYDATGYVLGSCTAQAGLLFKGQADCYGYSNTEELTFSKPELVPFYKIEAQRESAVIQPIVPTESVQPPAHTPISAQPTIQPLPESSRIELKPTTPLAQYPTQQSIKLFNETPILR